MLKKNLYIKTIIGTLKDSFSSSPLLHKLILLIETKIKQGKNISLAFKDSELLNSRQKELIEVSEETSNFPGMMEYIAKTNDEDYENNLKGIMSFIEPVILLLIGAVILIFILTFVLPMMDVG